MSSVAALLYEGEGVVRRRQIVLRDLQHTEVRVRIVASGICQTDRHVVAGALPIAPPLVLGHEAVGDVVAVGPSVHDVEVGDRVVLLTNPPCGRCWFCVRGEGQSCARALEVYGRPHAHDESGTEVTGFVGLGSFAEEAIVDASSVVPVHTNLPPEHLALIGCGVLTGAGAVLTSSARAGSSLAVFGCGGVGLAAVQAARAIGCTTILAVNPGAAKREAALSMGATRAVDPHAEDPEQVAREITDGRGVDIAIEAVGSTSTIRSAFRSTRVNGTTIITGLPSGGESLGLDATELVFHTRSIQGSAAGGGDPRVLVPKIVAMAEAGMLDLGALVTRTISFDDLEGAMAASSEPGIIRTVAVY